MINLRDLVRRHTEETAAINTWRVGEMHAADAAEEVRPSPWFPFQRVPGYLYILAASPFLLATRPLSNLP
jgi:hypothetical protein